MEEDDYAMVAMSRRTKGKALNEASAEVKQVTKKWDILRAEGESKVPKFELSELNLGAILGKGAFCDVNEITGVFIDGQGGGGKGQERGTAEVEDEYEEEEDDYVVRESIRGAESIRDLRDYINEYEKDSDAKIKSTVTFSQDRSFISKHVWRNGDARYAIKRLNKKTLSTEDSLIQGVVDLVRETMILANIQHPNILKLRGASAGSGGKSFNSDHFLLLDRLYDTLSVRLQKWKEAEGKMFVGKKKKKKMLLERINFGFDLASALRYLHRKNIIHRDLKPDNIGFDVRGDLKLFDFGLAKEVPQSDNEDDVFKLSGEIGSLRYMAPEVRLCESYNLKADVFSFSILLWQMCALSTPFPGFNSSMLLSRVVEQKVRPPLNKSWPEDLVFVLENTWEHDIEDRISMTEARSCLLPLINPDDGGQKANARDILKASKFN